MVDPLRYAVEQAVLAPSSHNTQPWCFRITSTAVELYADRRRQLAVVDPEGRELVMSCGAALLNLELALVHLDRDFEVTLLPEPGEPDLLARVRLGGEREPSEADEALFAAIERRRTHRQPFRPTSLPVPLVATLGEEARAEGARLLIVADEARGGLVELVAEGDRLQFSDKRFRRELAAWCTPNGSRRLDGIPGYALGFGNFGSRLAPLAIRTLDLGRRQAAKSRELAQSAPLLALVATDDDSAAEWLRAGRALQRVLLAAAAAGVSASFLNQPIELPELRAAVQRLAGVEGFPQLLLRLGYAEDGPPTPRRPASEVTSS